MSLSKSSDGVCPVCRTHVGRPSLVLDHCHKCGTQRDPWTWRGYICDPCNKALTDHLEDYWKSAEAYLSAHTCRPRLLDMPPLRVYPREVDGPTRQMHLGNGANDPRTIRISTDPAFVTIEQLAAIWGVAAGTARDIVVGRRGRTGNREVILTSLPDALNHIRKRWNL